MAGSSERFGRLSRLQALCVLAIVVATLQIGAGVVGFTIRADDAAIFVAIAGLVLLLLSLVVWTITPLVFKIESTLARQLSELRDLQEAMAKQVSALEALVENTRLSDAAKALAHRQEELDALRLAVREDLLTEKWEAALYLVDEIERRFGYKGEADQLREELDNARNQAIQAKLQDAVTMIESHFQAHDWDRAQREMERLRNALPDSPRVLALHDRMNTLKEEHKQELKLAWEETVRRNDTDRAIDVLRELDQYLSPSEARELQSSARNVFKEKLLQLGVQFRFAVTEKRWSDALATGLELIREFPNARMANEVREALDTLRERARAVSQVEGPQSARQVPS